MKQYQDISEDRLKSLGTYIQCYPLIFSVTTMVKQTRFHERVNSVTEPAGGNENRNPNEKAHEKRADAAAKDQIDAAMMFVMMQQSHQDQLNQIQESQKAMMEMAQQSMKHMAEQMVTMVRKR